MTALAPLALRSLKALVVASVLLAARLALLLIVWANRRAVS